MDALAAFGSASFDWVMRLDNVWRDIPYDVPSLNAALRRAVLGRLEQMASASDRTSPLGWIALGPAGAGKTHLLSSLRRETSAGPATFILADMTDVNDFWETVLLGYLSSLREPEERPQGRLALEKIFEHLGNSPDKAARNVSALARMPQAMVVKNTARALQLLAKKDRHKVIEHQDTLRALILLNSNDFNLSNLGYNWLLGLGLEDDEARRAGIRQARQSPVRIVRGLSWAMGMGGPTLLAFDQLDAIVTEQHLASGLNQRGEPTEEQRASKAIIEGIGRGLSALADHTQATFCLVSCLESTWETLRRTVLHSSTDRFETPRNLAPLTGADTARLLVEQRLALAYQAAGFTPGHPSWPFRAEAFEEAVGLTPREILKRCESHRQTCLDNGRVMELAGFRDEAKPEAVVSSRDEFQEIDAAFTALKQEADPAGLLAEENEDALGELLQAACRCLIREAPLPDDVDVLLETRFGGGHGYAPLHARLRLVYIREGAEETHICFRALQKVNHNAYMARLKAAMTASGIDRSLTFRRLFIVRRNALPGGPRSKETTAAFSKAGGKFGVPPDEDLRAFWALKKLDRNPPGRFAEWLQDRKPVSKLDLMRAAVPELCRPDSVPPSLQETPRVKKEDTPAGPRPLPLGVSLEAETMGQAVSLPLSALRRNFMVMSGSGSGQTVLVRRLVEEAALLGLPAVVIDAGDDFTGLGHPWPQAPDHWAEGDEAKADNFFQRAEVLVWTPGLSGERPLVLPVLPDFEAVADDSEALDDAVFLALRSLSRVMGIRPGKKKLSVLASALRYFAQRGSNGLMDLIALLSDLPPEAGVKLRAGPRLALETAEQLRAKVLADPQLGRSDPQADTDALFAGRESGQTRISVVSLGGLSSLEARRQFVSQLAISLLAWAKRQGASGGGTPKALVVLDGAKDFLPPGPPARGWAGLTHLTAQGGKYGLGLVLAAQDTKAIDTKTLVYFSTWFFGRASAPQTIKRLTKLLAERGGAGQDPARLDPGQFYVASDGYINPPTKITVPMCLSRY
ncbi:MAG: ATPase [Thermodesulfobacteriota bacterium]|nr:ATPase [Thermodesulfobacteriota bacterium]